MSVLFVEPNIEQNLLTEEKMEVEPENGDNTNTINDIPNEIASASDDKQEQEQEQEDHVPDPNMKPTSEPEPDETDDSPSVKTKKSTIAKAKPTSVAPKKPSVPVILEIGTPLSEEFKKIPITKTSTFGKGSSQSVQASYYENLSESQLIRIIQEHEQCIKQLTNKNEKYSRYIVNKKKSIALIDSTLLGKENEETKDLAYKIQEASDRLKILNKEAKNLKDTIVEHTKKVHLLLERKCGVNLNDIKAARLTQDKSRKKAFNDRRSLQMQRTLCSDIIDRYKDQLSKLKGGPSDSEGDGSEFDDLDGLSEDAQQKQQKDPLISNGQLKTEKKPKAVSVKKSKVQESMPEKSTNKKQKQKQKQDNKEASIVPIKKTKSRTKSNAACTPASEIPKKRKMPDSIVIKKSSVSNEKSSSAVERPKKMAKKSVASTDEIKSEIRKTPSSSKIIKQKQQRKLQQQQQQKQEDNAHSSVKRIESSKKNKSMGKSSVSVKNDQSRKKDKGSHRPSSSTASISKAKSKVEERHDSNSEFSSGSNEEEEEDDDDEEEEEEEEDSGDDDSGSSGVSISSEMSDSEISREVLSK